MICHLVYTILTQSRPFVYTVLDDLGAGGRAEIGWEGRGQRRLVTRAAGDV